MSDLPNKMLEKNIVNFKRKKEFLICVDSDGCAIDSMTIKHTKCFAPCFIKSFNLKDDEERILKRWNEINLFSKYRGINRFKGVAMMLSEIATQSESSDSYIENLAKYVEWTEKTKTYSNKALEQYCASSKNYLAEKVLLWSKDVNEAIFNLTLNEKPAFKNVKAVLKEASKKADIAVVSSANSKAIISEWKNTKLLKYASVVLAQEDGTKIECIKRLLSYGYSPSKTIMLGDAFSDLNAAKKNSILFFPVIAGKEKQSWKKFLESFLPAFFNKTYLDKYEKKLIKKMKDRLN